MTVIELARGWWVPSPASSVVARYTVAAEETLAELYQHVRAFNLAVQAGAHVGVWPRMLAERFAKVVAFEPDPVNSVCAAKNLADYPGVILLDRALSDREELAPWGHSNSNTGKHKICPRGCDLVRTVTIDSLDLPACDLICLDVEGYELPALRGAAATVRQHRPVVLFEDIGHGRKYGFNPGAVADWLTVIGYREVARVHDDRIWVCPR